MTQDRTAREPKRDRWGRYLLPDPETGIERAWTRVTTVSGVLGDRYNLELWQQRMVALGLADRPDLLALVRVHRRDKRRLKQLVADALEAGNSEHRREIGTAIHAATEAADLGEPIDLGPPFDLDVAAYSAEMRRRGIRVVDGWVERILLAPQLGVAGTTDRLLECDEWELPRIGDVKTGATIHFSELDHAVQLAMYANATHYWDYDDLELKPMPEIDRTRGLIIWVPAGEARCEVHELDLELGYEAARVAVEVKAWRSRTGLSRPLSTWKEVSS